MSRQEIKLRRPKRKMGFYVAVGLLILLAVIELLPLTLVLINSFKTHAQISRNPFSLPTGFSLDNFLYAWKMGDFTQGFINSFKLSGTAIVLGVLCSTSMGFVLATRRVKTWKPLTLYFMMSTTVPLQMFLLPLYRSFVDFHLMGNPFAVGAAIAVWQLPMPIFLMRTYFLKVPFELEEAARVDGANTFQVFTRVMMPVVSPGMVTVAVIVGLSSWNEYLLSSTLLSGAGNLTVTLKYLNLNGVFSKDFGVMMSGAVIVILPMIIVFLLLQKQFIEGMSAGAVKG